MQVFGSPWWLLAWIAVVAFTVFYVVIQRRRPSKGFLFANYDILKSVARPQRRRRRHVPVVLLVVALSVLVVGMASPQGEYRVPRNRATVMLVIDVSRSMESTDVAPSRFEAAKVAATRFVSDLTEGINLGLVSYAGTATV